MVPRRRPPASRPGTAAARHAPVKSFHRKILGRVLSAEPPPASASPGHPSCLASRRPPFTTSDSDGRTNLPRRRRALPVTAAKADTSPFSIFQLRAFEPGRQWPCPWPIWPSDIALIRAARHHVRITDEFGGRSPGRRWKFSGISTPGRHALTFAGAGGGFVQTNDLGEFRAYGLMPGEYVISGIVRQPFASQNNANDASEGYAPTYYPGTPNPAEAELLTLGLTQEMSIQLTLQAARTRISGMSLTPSEAAALWQGQARSARDGRDGTRAAARVDGSFTLTTFRPASLHRRVAHTDQQMRHPNRRRCRCCCPTRHHRGLRSPRPRAGPSRRRRFEAIASRGVLGGYGQRSRRSARPGPFFVSTMRRTRGRRFEVRGPEGVLRHDQPGPCADRVPSASTTLPTTPYDPPAARTRGLPRSCSPIALRTWPVSQGLPGPAA